MRFFFILLFVLLGSFPAQAGPSSEFNTGWREFHRLLKTPEEAKFRSSWMRVKRSFHKGYTQAPNGPYAPKCLYYLGRTYQELGKRSYLKKDFLKAVDYFERVVGRFPSHSWSDDAKLYVAKIHLNNLQDRNQAYLDLLSIEHNYPDGDMIDEARSLLKELDKKYMQQVGMEPPQPDPVTSAPEKAGSTDTSSGTSPAPSMSSLAELMKVRHWSSDDYTRVVLDLDQETDFEHMLLKPDPKLKTPYRLVVDLTSSRLGQGVQEELAIEDGILQQVRTGQYRKTKTRVVLDVKELNNYRTFSLDNPFRVVVDVYAPESEARKRSARQATPEEDTSGTLVEQLGLDIQTVMIDPGHGGKDPGAVFGKLYEKDINLRLAKVLGSILEDKGYTVLYTRTKDVFIPLEERTAIANSKKADLFLSLHVNAHKNRNVHGLEVYYLNLATSKDAVRVAARENAVSTKKISDLQVILSDLMLNSKIKESSKLAETVLDKALSYSRKFYDLNDHGVRRAPFYVLMGAKMPAILVETGYLTNSEERKKLQSYTYLKRLAWGIANGINAYRQEIKKFAQL
jgi:N-acetylmuramoyl-L-alanine amidase